VSFQANAKNENSDPIEMSRLEDFSLRSK